MILSADVGGTFTDVVVVDVGQVTTAKVPTSQMQSVGVVAGARTLLKHATARQFLHGTTVATNALLERAGPRTMLVTDAGFEDVIEIGRQDRPSLYDSFDDRPTPLVDRTDRIAPAAISATVVAAVGAVAVALIAGHQDTAGEQAIAATLRSVGFDGPISLSSHVSPEFREFERTSTAVLNAYLTPTTAAYLEELQRAMVDRELAESMAVMQSSGGLASADHAAAVPASILLSGPAGGATAAAAFAHEHGHDRVISFDMGGTSTDVCRIDSGQFAISYERSIDGYPCRLPSAAINTVGAGGGSIAWIDAGGSLRVGPHSAGAQPGPACYGRGGNVPTVTDAHAVLGRLDPSVALGNTLHLDPRAAASAVAKIAEPLSTGISEAAHGIIAIAEATMARAVRTVSVEQGADPTGAFLYAFGGAGGLHASSLARSLGMTGAVIPPHGGVFSALGLLLARPRVDAATSTLGRAMTADGISSVAIETAADASAALVDAGTAVASVSHLADVRYIGQAHEITVPFEPGDSIDTIAARFHEAHTERNGYARPDDPIEIVTVRATASGDPALTLDDLATHRESEPVAEQVGDVDFGDGPVATRLVWRQSLTPGAVVTGPAVIREHEATTVVHPGDTARILDSGAIELTW